MPDPSGLGRRASSNDFRALDSPLPLDRGEQVSLPALVMLHLAPGVLGGLVYIALAAPVLSYGYPPIAVLLLAIGIVTLPAEIGMLIYAHRRGDTLFVYRDPIATRHWLSIVPTLLGLAVAASALLMGTDNAIAKVLFGWAPEWYLKPLDLDAVRQYPTKSLAVTVTAYVILNGIVGPVVEEFYFRGWLLSRMSRYGRWAPVISTTLFSIYHVWSPWQFFSRVVAVAPYVYAVWRRRNVYLGVTVHVLLNTVGSLLLVGSIASRL